MVKNGLKKKKEEMSLRFSGKNHPLYGKEHTKETKEKMRSNQWLKGKGGKEHPRSK